VSSALVGALTRRNRSDPSGDSTHNSVEEQHLEVDVDVQRAAEALDQRHRAGLDRLTEEPRLLGQVHGDAPVDNAEHS